MNTPSALATFGAGCFWGVEELFRTQKGVLGTAVGYMGGATERPTYEQVCRDRSGHAEVVQVEYDPSIISYEQLLALFWENHNPTMMNRQGPDTRPHPRTPDLAENRSASAATGSSEFGVSTDTPHSSSPVSLESGTVSAQKRVPGWGLGTQYRSVIFYHTPEQEAIARASKDALAQSGKWKSPIVTVIEPAHTFWKAEEYHQQYLMKRGEKVCHV